MSFSVLGPFTGLVCLIYDPPEVLLCQGGGLAFILQTEGQHEVQICTVFTTFFGVCRLLFLSCLSCSSTEGGKETTTSI